MGKCIYCGKQAGFLRTKHDECESKHEELERTINAGREHIAEAVSRTLILSKKLDSLKRTIYRIEKSSFVPSSDRKALLLKGWENAIEHLLDNGIIDKEHESRLAEFQSYFDLSQEDLDANGSMTKSVKAVVLREVLKGVIPQKVIIEGNLPVNVQKGEKVVWMFPSSKLLEDITRRRHVGSSQGFSIKLFKGVYYRSGSYRGIPVDYTEQVCVGTGTVVVTDKTFYFGGSETSVRIPYTNVVSFLPISDGIGIIRDIADAKPQSFITGDGWFTYNLVTNLARI